MSTELQEIQSTSRLPNCIRIRLCIVGRRMCSIELNCTVLRVQSLEGIEIEGVMVYDTIIVVLETCHYGIGCLEELSNIPIFQLIPQSSLIHARLNYIQQNRIR